MSMICLLNLGILVLVLICRLFIGCVLYADDILLMSPSCRGLQNLVSICERHGLKWDIKFNPCKSQVTTFGGSNPSNMCINLAGTAVQWSNKVKYLGLSSVVIASVVILDILRSQIMYENSMVSITTYVLCLDMVLVKCALYICVKYTAYPL